MSHPQVKSKLPKVGTTIFTKMSALAQKESAINLSQGFPDFQTPELLRKEMMRFITEGKNQYAPMAGAPELRHMISEKISDLYDYKADADTMITVTAGATQAIFTIINALVREGDEVIVIEPAYDSYVPSIELAGASPIYFTLEYPDYKIDWDQFKKLINSSTKMIILNSPHNPTGSCLSAEDLGTLQKLLEGSDIMVLSDEVYEHIIYDGMEHQSVLRYPSLAERSIVVYSFGKTYHNTGWKIGYCVAAENLMVEIRKVHQFNVFSVHAPSQYAIAKMMEQTSWYSELSEFYQIKRDYFRKLIADSRFRPLICSGTYFQLLDFKSITEEADTDFAERLTIEHKIASIPISVFYAHKKDDSVLRFCFAKDNDTLEKAAEILCSI